MEIFTRIFPEENEGLLVVWQSRVLIEPDFALPVSFPTIPFPWAFFSSFLASTRFLLSQAGENWHGGKLGQVYSLVPSIQS